MRWTRNHYDDVIFHGRPHPRTLFSSIIVCILGVAGAFALLTWLPEFMPSEPPLHLLPTIAAAVFLIGALLNAAIPLFAWLTMTYTVYPDRVVIRRGFIATRERTLPMGRITTVEVTRSLIDRLFRTGTLVIYDPSERDTVKLHAIRDIDRVNTSVKSIVTRQYQPRTGWHNDNPWT